jgi:hypothetical protein
MTLNLKDILDEIAQLTDQRKMIDRQIEALQTYADIVDSQPKQRRRKLQSEATAEPKPKGRPRKEHIVPKLTDIEDDLPEPADADDEEELEDEPVVERRVETARVAKRFDYKCQCGYSFKSTIPPQLIKCPDCMGKPKVVEEAQKEE